MNKEIWKPITGYEGYYEVSNKGRIKSLIMWNGHRYKTRDKPKILKQSNTTTGYKKVELSKEGVRKSYKVHRLVGIEFIPNPENKPNINHIDFNPINNEVENLEWCTQKENMNYSNTIFRKRNILSYEDELIIIQEYKRGNPASKLAKQFGCSDIVIYNALERNGIKRRSGSEVRNKYNIDLDLFKKMVDEGYSNKKMVERFNCSSDIIATRKYQYKKGII